MLNYIQAHARAQDAIRAAQNRYKWGPAAARSFAIKRGILRLFVLACQLEAMKEYDKCQTWIGKRDILGKSV